jgi:serine/threonine protein kinase
MSIAIEVHAFTGVESSIIQTGNQANVARLYAETKVKRELDAGVDNMFYVYKTTDYVQKESQISGIIFQRNGFGPHVSPMLGISCVSDTLVICKYKYAGPTLFRVMLSKYIEREWDNFTLTMYTNLRRYIFDHKELVCTHVLDAYEKLHAVEVVHRDAKLDNICIHPQTFQVCIIDFDTSFILPQNQQNNRNSYWIMELTNIDSILYDIRNFNM